MPTGLILALLHSPHLSAAETSAFETDFDLLHASDISLIQGATGAGISWGQTFLRAGINGGWMGLDYQPVDADIFGTPERIEESRVGASLSISRLLHEHWTVLADAGAYDGFNAYRSAWVSTWYRQFFNGLPGLREPDPRGLNGSLGLRWEYLPGLGVLQFEAGLASDEIAPGYEEILDEFGGLVDVAPLRSRLATQVLRVAFENVVTSRIRTRVSVRMNDQAERLARWTATAEINASLSRTWVLRLDGGYAREPFREPAQGSFEGHWFGGALEWQMADSWQLILRGRHYRDSGEIENTLSFSTAAPGLDAEELGIGLRWSSGSHTLQIGAGPYRTRYGPVTFNTTFFGNLYRDRTFVAAQLSYRWEF
jgi:hypothetical protein